MAKKALTLDTPFRPGEKVVAAAAVGDIAEGTKGKIELANGLGVWRRYWVKFDGGRMRGQVSHQMLARPSQLAEWHQHQADLANAALRKTQAAETATAAVGAGDAAGGAGGGVASRIPAAILERSKAAKARKLG